MCATVEVEDTDEVVNVVIDGLTEIQTKYELAQDVGPLMTLHV